MVTPTCPFCQLSPGSSAAGADREVIASNPHATPPLAYAIRDNYPVSPGHTLIIPHRHIPTWFDATRDEHLAILDLIDQVRADLLATPNPPDAFNIGINSGPAAGQTVPHLHVHVIPRYTGDVDDPRGGVRFVIPHKANYLLGNYKAPGRIPRRPPTPGPRLTTGGTDPFITRIRDHLDTATEVDIVAAFVNASGLDDNLLGAPLQAAIRRGAHIRLITGDYLHITQEEALRQLLSLTQTYAPDRAPTPDPHDDTTTDATAPQGTFEARIVRTALIPSNTFHPKSWRFATPDHGVAWVGSSNISRAALDTGVEWNLAADSRIDPDAYRDVRNAFASLWSTHARPLTQAFVDAYRERRSSQPDTAPQPLWTGGEHDLTREPPPDPRPIQTEALAALATTRRDGNHRGLVVLATGLGKTYLAAFDLARFVAARAPQPTRAAFIAHRREILEQAATTLSRVLPDASQSWFSDTRTNLTGDLVFASVHKLGRPEHLTAIAPDHFDYLIVDEAHHSTASTYRRILAHLAPTFVLGLTATPDRADQADVQGLFNDHLSFRLDLGEGIERAELAPFRYIGVKDTIEYTSIPWRNRRFDPTELAQAAQTVARMETLWTAWTRYPGTRTLVFCCSIAHARFVRDHLQARGLNIAVCHSDPDSDPRARSLARLGTGDLDAICAVDLFNEGVDVPSVDRVVMLRPTESPTLFLQQLGRGLRLPVHNTAAGKSALRVIDFVGNHRVFLDRLRTLLDLAATSPGVRPFLDSDDNLTLDLPEGCSVELQLEARQLLRQLLPKPGTNETVRAYRDLRATRDHRPTAGELYRLGYNPRSLRTSHHSWLQFVHDEGDLTPAESAALTLGADWFRHLETTATLTPLQLVTLEVLLEHEALLTGLPTTTLADHAHRLITDSPELFAEIATVRELTDPHTADPSFHAYWRKNPLHYWAKGPYFELRTDSGQEHLHFTLAGLRTSDRAVQQALTALTFEVADYRMAVYRRGRSKPASATSFTVKLITNKRHPIIKLPSRTRQPGLPQGPTDVRLPDGTLWRFHFVKIAINKAAPVGTHTNQLPDLLRTWFGPQAGQPGTRHELHFHRSPDGWWVEPLAVQLADTTDTPPDNVIPLRRPITTFPTLRAAAGWTPDAHNPEAIEPDTVHLPLPPLAPDHFAIRASGDSMRGILDPAIHDGDWLVMRWQRSASAQQLEGQVALIARGEPGDDRTYHLKRLVQRDGTWLLSSDNPDHPTLRAEPTDDYLALLDRVIRPEELAPGCGTVIDEDDLAEAFALEAPPEPPFSRVGGHLFILLQSRETLAGFRTLAPIPALTARPGETAFVLAAVPEPTANVAGSETTASSWRYLGTARQDEARAWTLDNEVDFTAWRAHGHGRSASRALPDWAMAEARPTVAGLLTSDLPRWVEAGGKRFRIIGESAKGGLRIDGGPDGFNERTVSLIDIGWVLVAARDVANHGGVLDEARVNRLRYLDGTPKNSTRWIDTGWALRICTPA